MKDLLKLSILILITTSCASQGEEDSSSSEAASQPVQELNVKMISPESSSSMTLSDAVTYCRELNAACEYHLEGESCSALQSGWTVPRMEDISLFIHMTNSINYIWTRTPYAAVLGAYTFMNMRDGAWGYDYHYSPYIYVRCVK